MRKGKVLLLAAAVAAAGWFFFDRYELEGLDEVRLVRRIHVARSNNIIRTAPPSKGADTIRIASFNIQVFGVSKSNKSHVMEYLTRIARQFDILAIQEIRSIDEDVIPRYVELINSTGRHFDYVIGPRLGRTSSKEQYAFIFDRETIEIDRTQLYTVHDPDDLLHREPFVGWFRVRGPPPSEAFTFTLVNVHTDPDEVDEELAVMDDVYYAVLNDHRDEDDIIILGDFNANYRNLGPLSQISGMMWAISDATTNTAGNRSYDNLVFNGEATSNYTGRRGVFDFMREYNLTREEAQEISDHLPVWAEFSAYDTGQPGRFATRPAEDGIKQ